MQLVWELPGTCLVLHLTGAQLHLRKLMFWPLLLTWLMQTIRPRAEACSKIWFDWMVLTSLKHGKQSGGAGQQIGIPCSS